MVRPGTDADFAAILEIVNDGAQRYKGVIPADRWHEPYMSAKELKSEIAAGVAIGSAPVTSAQSADPGFLYPAT